jgi:hypothetical protein
MEFNIRAYAKGWIDGQSILFSFSKSTLYANRSDQIGIALPAATAPSVATAPAMATKQDRPQAASKHGNTSHEIAYAFFAMRTPIYVANQNVFLYMPLTGCGTACPVPKILKFINMHNRQCVLYY